MATSVLIGNGINQLSTRGIRWPDVLKHLATTLDLPNAFLEDKRPFTMLFDEATLCAHETHSRTQVKKLIAEALEGIVPNECHARLVALKIRHILTTNYDYAIELASDHLHKDASVREAKYSLFRRRRIGETSVWHIHGEVENARSLVLGFDQYMGQLQRMRGYLKTSYAGRKALFKRGIMNFESAGEDYSWVDVFLRDDLHIAGLGLNFVESDIWWMLYYKARMKRRGLPVGRTFYYRVKKQNPSELDLAAMIEQERALIANDVELIDADSQGNHRAAWDVVLDALTRAANDQASGR